MVDVAQDPQRLREKAKIYVNITHDDLLEVLSAIERSLHISNPLQSVTAQQPENRINPYFFENSFAPDKGVFYFLDPFLPERISTTETNVISRKDVIDLYESIEELISKGELGLETALGPDHADLLRRIKNGLPNNKEQLEEDSSLMVNTIALLKSGEEKEEEAGGVEVGIPIRLKQLIDRPFDLEESWKIVKSLVQDARGTPLDSTTISTFIEGDPTILQVIQFRFFINDWLKKLYSDDFKIILESKRIVLPEMSLFAATNKFFTYIDREEWNDQDQPIVEFILKDLSPVIDDFLKAKVIVRQAYETESTESAEGENNVTDPKKTPEQLDELLEKFSAAGKSYAAESNRLTTVLLPTFFTMQGIRRPFDELGSIDDVNFRLVEREFRLELENVLRSLSPKELELLSTRGASLEFRLIVLRKLYGKLSTNPRFIGSLQQYKETYVKYVQKKIDIKEASPKDLIDLNAQINLSDAKFDQQLGEVEKNSRDNWSSSLAKGGNGEGQAALADFAGFNSVTQADLKSLLINLSGNTFSGEDYTTLFRNLDVIISERWSLEQIRTLSATEIQTIFGVNLPTAVGNDPRKFSLFLDLCTEYLYARRQHLADHYRLDVISRDNGKSIDRASFTEAQALAKEHGSEALIIGRASDKKRISEYGSNIAPGIKAVYNKSLEKRKNQIDADYADKDEESRKFGAMSIKDKRELLTSLGVLTGELDDMSVSDQQKIQLLQQRYEEEMFRTYQQNMADLDDLSAYEDEDDGTVADGEGGVGQRPRPQRYGEPGGKSLLSGAVGLRKKVKTAKKRVSQAKAAIKAVDKVSDKLEQAALTPVMGPIAQNKTARRITLALAIGAIVDTFNMIANGVFSKALAGLGGVIGGGVAVLSGAGAPLVVPATIFGAWGGARLGNQIDKMFGFGQGGAKVSVPSLNIGGSGSRAAQALGKFGGGGGGGVNLTGAASQGGSLGPVAYLSGSVVTVCYVVSTTIMASLQTPPLSTIGSNGSESPYVTITKEVISSPGNPSAETEFSGAVPSELAYRITVQAKDDYQIEITNFTDEFTITTNNQLNKETPAALSCPNLSPASLTTKTVSAATGPLVIGECTVPLNQTYHDSSILNEFTLIFKVSQAGQPAKEETATSGVPVCLGKCPAKTSGCWPVKGILTQGAYGEYSHSSVDAYDIGASFGNPEYATFKGKAWAFDTSSPDTSKQGYLPLLKGGGLSHIYGKHVFLVTNQGFTLLYGHMSRHAEMFDSAGLGVPVDVNPGDLLGYVGNSGYDNRFAPGAMGVHLHYEYRIPMGSGTWHSTSPKGKDYLAGIVPKLPSGPKPAGDDTFVFQDKLAVDTYPNCEGASP